MGLKNEERLYSVYKHTSPDGKVYIGATSQIPEKRWGKDGKGYRIQPRMNEAIENIGWDNFDHEIVASGMIEEEAHNMEKELIEKYNATDAEHGYNMVKGGKGMLGYIMSEENRRKQSERVRGENHPFYGKHHSEETRRKLSESHKGQGLGKPLPKETREKISRAKSGKNHHFYGKYLSDEHKRKLSESLNGEKNPRYGIRASEETRRKQSEAKRGEKHPNYGKHLSEETREKIRAANTGKHPTEETRRKLVESHLGITPSEETKIKMRNSSPNRKRTMCIETGIIYSSASEAARQTGFSNTSITNACTGVRETSHGYHWKYI